MLYQGSAAMTASQSHKLYFWVASHKGHCEFHHESRSSSYLERCLQSIIPLLKHCCSDLWDG